METEFDEWVERMTAGCRKTTAGILETAAICANPPDGVDDKLIKSRADALPFGAATLSKFGTIGRAKWLHEPEMADALPASHTIIYVLAKRGEAKVRGGIKGGVVHPKMARVEAEALGGESSRPKADKAALSRELLAAIKRPAKMEETRRIEFRRAVDELGQKFGVEVVHAESDAVRSAEARWRKQCQQVVERAKARQGAAWALSDEECAIGKNTSAEEAQALLTRIGIGINVRTLIDQAYAIEGVDLPGPGAPRADKKGKAA